MEEEKVNTEDLGAGEGVGVEGEKPVAPAEELPELAGDEDLVEASKKKTRMISTCSG